MQVANFSQYYLAVKAIKKVLKEISLALILFIIALLLFFSMVIFPARRLIRMAHLNDILNSRCEFIEDALVKIETRQKYWMAYYNHFLRQRFSNLWNNLWSFLEESLPENAWVESVEWSKTSSGTYRLLVKGKALLNGNIDEMAKKLNELGMRLKDWGLSDYIERIEIEEVQIDPEGKVGSYVICFYPKNIPMG